MFERRFPFPTGSGLPGIGSAGSGLTGAGEMESPTNDGMLIASKRMLNLSTETEPTIPAGPVAPNLADQVLHLARCLEDALTNMTNSAGLNEARYCVLDALIRSTTTGCSQTRLADELRQSESNLSTLLDRMSRDGLIERRRDPADRRKSVIVLTQTGRELLIKARAYRDSVLDEMLRSGSPELPAVSQKVLQDLTDLVTRYLSDARARLLLEQEMVIAVNEKMSRIDRAATAPPAPHFAATTGEIRIPAVNSVWMTATGLAPTG